MKRTVFLKTYLKIIRTEGTPSSIARGVALGLAVGLIIPVGLQTAPAIFLAFVFKANKVLTWMCTCVTNPATAIVIYPVQCWIGSYLIFHPISFSTFTAEFNEVVHAESIAAAWQAFTELSGVILLSFFAGGLLFAIIAAPLGGILGYKAALAYQEHRKRRLQNKANANGKEISA